MESLQGKKAFITGGTRGLGFSLCKKLLSAGCEVYTVSSNQASIDSAKNNLGSENFHAYKCDVSEYAEISSVAQKVGGIDILINNAGVWLEGNVIDNDPRKISRVIDVNTKGVIYATKAFLPEMIKVDRGTIINVSSTSGLRGRENQSVYVASKFAVQGFTESLKEDLKDTGIKIIGFYPGGMNTKIFETAGFQKENADWMDTDKVAEVVLFMLQQDDTMILDHVVLNRGKTKKGH